MLKSRQKYSSSEQFRDEFLKTITPGIIERKNFIKWEDIKDKVGAYKNFFPFLSTLADKSDKEFTQTLADSIRAADNPEKLIKTCFEFLGHTDDKKYVSNEDNLRFHDYGNKISEKEAKSIGQLFIDLGLKNIVDTEIADYFLGVQVGLETNRRKNVGGDAFKVFVKGELEKIQNSLNREDLKVELKEEERIFYKDGITSKKVDFCFAYKGKKPLGIEVNFYTVSGSKPTEIKRSYGQVNQELTKVGTELVWVTDGIGYEDMKNSLKEAFDIHKNTYNFRMMKDELGKDILELLK